MPVDRRKRTVRHGQPSRPNNTFTEGGAPVSEKITSKQGPDVKMQETIVSPSSLQPLPLKKKEKQKLKHQALLERLSAHSAPYSKSHIRRLRRKEKEKLSADLTSVNEAIFAIEEKANEDMKQGNSGQIGEGKSSSLSENQRKRTFQAESLRHKLVMQDTTFVSNPFQTIRTHAQNTLLKRQP